MNTRFRTLLIGVLGLSALLTSCAGDDQPALVLGEIVIGAGDIEDGTCVFDPAGDSDLIAPEPFLDLASPGGQFSSAVFPPNSFGYVFKVSNVLAASSETDPSGLRTDTNTIFIDEISIRWLDEAGKELYKPGIGTNPRSIAANDLCSGTGIRETFIEVGVGEIGSVPVILGSQSLFTTVDDSSNELSCLNGAVGASFFPGQNVDQVNVQLASRPVRLFAEVQLFGETVGGKNIESNIIKIPVGLCKGCGQPSTDVCIDAGG